MNPARRLLHGVFGAALLVTAPLSAASAQVPGNEDPVAAAAADRALTAPKPVAKTAAPEMRSDDSAQTVAAALAKLPPLAPGPIQPNWDSIRVHFRVPDWFRDAKFGIMMHWGLYSVPAVGSEWYVRHLYGGNKGIMQQHIQRYGPLDKFGYKDFIPMFTAAKWEPDAWAALFKKAGARYVISSGEHHDGWSNWDSKINPYNAKAMGPKRDLVGELNAAVARIGLNTGVANHSNNHFNFIRPMPGTDLYDPKWADFYSVADRSEAARITFLEHWVTKNLELINQYQPDMLWFDMNGGDRSWDPLKLYLLAYYYNRALEWGKPVAVSSKGESFLAGMVMDYERQGRAPKQLTDYVWQPDDPIGDKFGYVEGMGLKPAGSLIRNLALNVSRNGNLLLNISPKADGTIPEAQQKILLEIGHWLDVNGDAIYATRPWKISQEGGVLFTTKGDTLYTLALDWPKGPLVIPALATGRAPGSVTNVELLGHPGKLDFTQGPAGLKVTFPAEKPCDYVFALKITGLNL